MIDDDDPQVGVNLFVLEPGQPMSMYHWEADQEGFLVLSGEALLDRRGRGAAAAAVGLLPLSPEGARTRSSAPATGLAAILAIGARENAEGDWGGYPYSEVAMQARTQSAEEETTDQEVAYARFPKRVDGEFREGWLP